MTDCEVCGFDLHGYEGCPICADRARRSDAVVKLLVGLKPTFRHCGDCAAWMAHGVCARHPGSMLTEYTMGCYDSIPKEPKP
jgi:recombinational DNA repair protein RecR